MGGRESNPVTINLISFHNQDSVHVLGARIWVRIVVTIVFGLGELQGGAGPGISASTKWEELHDRSSFGLVGQQK